jgi:HEPN domain-containing protein
MAELSKQLLVQLAEEKLRDARLLLEAGRSSNAYYLAGYAIELMLKAIVSTEIQAETIPRSDLMKGLFTHDVEKLVSLANLKGGLAKLRDADPEFAAFWELVLDWRETSRYEMHDDKRAEQLLRAIDDPDHGVLRWLRGSL